MAAAKTHSAPPVAGAWDRIAAAGVSPDAVATLHAQCDRIASTLADADLALSGLDACVAASDDAAACVARLVEQPDRLAALLTLLASSRAVADQLAEEPHWFDAVHRDDRPPSRDTLVDELLAELAGVTDPAVAADTLRRAKRRETTRIAYADVVRGASVAAVSGQVSALADAVLEAAVAFTRRRLDERFGVPLRRDGERARFCVLALGKLGGAELNYSSDIDLVFLYDEDGHTDHPRTTTNREYFDRLAQETLRLVGPASTGGAGYRVDLRLRPDGSRAPICQPLASMVAYYDTRGRTWERQAFIKARAAAGDHDLGDELLATLRPWVYRTYLSLADIAGIKALKRRIEHRSEREGADDRNVKTGRGGLRDVEFVIQFLQLLNGGALPEVRTGNTLEAIERLQRAGCLTPAERGRLEEGYHFLRRVEHRLQLLHDQQTHTLPDTPGELRALAVRLGYDSTGTGGGGKSGGGDPVAAFQADLAKRTADNRRILDHLLYDAFDDEGAAEPEVDLVNDPNPSKEEVRRALSRHPLGDPHAAYEHLMSLATERVRFLSPRRCRHFLASITPRLLAAIARTPDPVATLVSLSRASDSLGGKAALWELFSQNPGALNLYVRLCAAAPYLAEILTTNPGMIDELMDSLLVRRLPWHAELEASLADLTRGAEDLDPILHSFKNAQHLRVGVRDLLGRDDIRGTHRALADVAECCVAAIARREHARLIDRHGEPTIGPPDASHAAIDPADAADLARREGQPSAGVILAMGKLGGREPNYHSDLDLVFLYEGDGPTVPRRRSRRLEPTNNAHFYSELGQRIITAAGRLGPYGRLYEVDARLRPTGRGGALAVSIPALRRYFASGQADLWERLALCKARVISGEPAAAERAMAAVAEAAYGPAWRPEHAAEVRAMRDRLERSAGRRNLKRGPGGTIDTEFLVQTLQLRHGGADESIRLPGTLAALGALEAAGHLPPDDAAFFRESYRLQRSVESAVRLMNSPARHEYPNDPAELKKLAFLLGYPGGETLRERLERCRNETRVRFERLMGG